MFMISAIRSLLRLNIQRMGLLHGTIPLKCTEKGKRARKLLTIYDLALSHIMNVFWILAKNILAHCLLDTGRGSTT